MSKYLKTNKNTGNSAALKKVRRNIYWQAGLALVTIVLTIVIIFAMTSAWYTNIVQTSGLVFQAEAWGFDGEITVNAGNIVASPGDEGIIHMEAKNTSDSIAAVSITASKTRIEDPEMRKRLYVYVDTQMMRNGEAMNRVYLNNQDSFTYTLFSQGKLTLTEQLHSDAQLKWQWVYDVLGYYVLCSYNKDTGKITEIEYLRPVEYDYDEATTTFQEGENGAVTKVLKTVDGETTVEEFLKQLSETDGYEEDIDFKNPFDDGYYPVDVDLETDSEDYGYGVYVYLYSYAEIEAATAYDTKLGEEAAKAAEDKTEPASYPVVLTISAQKNDENVLSISSLSALNTAMEQYPGATLQLTSDITITEEDPLVIPEGARVMLDLNENQIISTSTKNTIEAEPGSSLTLINGELVGSGSGRGVYAVGAEVVMSNVKLDNFSNGVYVSDSDDKNVMDSRVRIVNCELHTTNTTVFTAGNGLASAQKTQIVIENSELSSDNIVVSGNGDTQDNGRWGTDIQIINSTITSNPDDDPNIIGAGIYHPQKDSTLTISGSTVSGYTGIAIKGGSVYVDASTISGTGAQNAPGEYTSGFADTGDAIYIEANYGYEILLEISGDSVLTSAHSKSLQVYKEDAKHVTVRIYSGVFDEPPLAEYIAAGSVVQDNKVIVPIQP